MSKGGDSAQRTRLVLRHLGYIWTDAGPAVSLSQSHLTHVPGPACCTGHPATVRGLPPAPPRPCPALSSPGLLHLKMRQQSHSSRLSLAFHFSFPCTNILFIYFVMLVTTFLFNSVFPEHSTPSVFSHVLVTQLVTFPLKSDIYVCANFPPP